VADVFEVLTASESEQSIAKKAAADTLAAAIYDVREQFGEHLFIAKSKDEFHDRLALCKDDMMKTVNAHLMPVTGVMRRVCKTMEREWRERTANRPLHEIARDIKTNWPKVNYAAQPYLDALHELESVDDMYYADPASHIVNYFLSNARSWRGPEAKRIKDELKGLVSRRANRLAYSDEELEAYKETVSSDEKPPRPKAKPFPDTDGEWKKADNTGPVQSLEQTYSPSDGPLVPEGDFHAYQNSVDQNADSTVSGNFTPGEDSGSDKHGYRTANEVMGYPADGGMPDAGMATPPPAPGMDPTTGAGMVAAPPGTGGSGPEMMTAAIIKRYAQWCVANLARPSVQTLEYYAANRPDLDYFVLTAALQKHAEVPGGSASEGLGHIINPFEPSPEPKALDPNPYAGLTIPENFDYSGGSGGSTGQFTGAYLKLCRQQGVQPTLQGYQRFANLHTAAGKGKDYLLQADEAITNLLNEKAEEFQESITPLQQALQTIQYAEQVQQAQNPMGVMPPAGTVNVMPQTQGPAGPAPAGVDPSGQVDPAMLAQLMGMGGGDPSQMQDPNAGIPPAAAQQGAVPPEMQMQARRRRAQISLSDVRIEDRGAGLCSGTDPAGHRVMFQASPEDMKDLLHVMQGDLAQNFSGVSVDEEDIVDMGPQEKVPSHGEQDPYGGGDGDINRSFTGTRRTASRTSDLIAEYESTPHDDVKSFELEEAIHRLAEQGDPEALAFLNGHDEQAHDAEGHDYPPTGHMARRRTAMPMTEDGYDGGDGWVPGQDFDPHDPDEMEIMEHIWEGEKLNRMQQLEEENARLRSQLDPGGERQDYENYHDNHREGAVSELGYPEPEEGFEENHKKVRKENDWPEPESRSSEKRGGRGKARGAARPQSRGRTASGDLGHCQMGSGCGNQADLTLPLRILGDVPFCRPCAERYVRVKDRYRKETQEKNRAQQKSGGILEEWQKWQQRRSQSGKLGIGGDKDIEDFAAERGYGSRGVATLRKHLYGQRTGWYESYGERKKALRKQAWSGWGPSQVKRNHAVDGWDWDKRLSAYVASSPPEHFICKCGSKLAVPGYHNCKCGKIWNSYVIGTGGENRQAAVEKFLCREIAVRDNVIVANNRTAGRPVRDSQGNPIETESDGYVERKVVRQPQRPEKDPDRRPSDFQRQSLSPEDLRDWWDSVKHLHDNSEFDPRRYNPTTGKYWTGKDAPEIGASREAAKTAKDGGCTCWEGYERVPGTEPCASGSCRKKTSGRDTPAAQPSRRGDSWKYREMLAADEDDSDEWPSEHHPNAGKSTMSKPPADWHHRDRGGKWTA
jgi:hypothetical protein